MNTPSCRRTLLAQSPVGQVEQCACGMVHLTVGPCTLRFDPDVLRAVAAMLHAAVHAPAPAGAPERTTPWGHA